MAVPIEGTPFDHPEVEKWWSLTERIVEEAFGAHHRNFSQFVFSVTQGNATRQQRQQDHFETMIGKKALLQSFIEQLELLQPQSSAVAVKAGREGVFFAGQTFDALYRAAQIFSDAKMTIRVVDGYIGEDLLNLLAKKQAGVIVEILTKPLSASLVTLCKAFNQQYRGLSVRSSGAFHDRFVIVDDREFFHFGASIKDAGKRGFMFSLIEERKSSRPSRTCISRSGQSPRSRFDGCRINWNPLNASSFSCLSGRHCHAQVKTASTRLNAIPRSLKSSGRLGSWLRATIALRKRRS